MKIWHKLTLGFVSLALFIAFLGTSISISQSALLERVNVIHSSNIGEVRFSHEIAYHLQRVKSNIRLLILEIDHGSFEERAYAIGQIRTSLNEIDELVESLVKATEAGLKSESILEEGGGKSELFQIQLVRKELSVVMVLANRLLDHYADGGIITSEQGMIFEKKMQVASRLAQELMEEIEEDAFSEIGHSVVQIRAMIRGNIDEVIIFTFASFLFAILLGFFISRAIIRNITSLKQATVQIGSGQFDTIVQVRSSDELAELAAGINQMALNLQALTLSKNELSEEVDQRKRKEVELSLAKEVAEKADRAKSEFVANMSHEIRTPLHGLLGIAEHLRETQLNVEQKENVETLIDSGAMLLSLINDILDFSKIEAGQLELEQTLFDPRLVLQSTVQLLDQKAVEKGIKLVAVLGDSDLPLHVTGDLVRIRQILVNLAGNAVKFTDHGNVTINLIEERGDGVVRLRYLVRDSGIGIAKEKLDSIFDKFSQAEASTTRQYGGSGIGLTICRDLVELMGGEMGVESEVGDGSTFWFEISLPEVEVVEADVEQSTSKQAGEDALDLVRILAVDDNAVNRKVLELHLGKLGCIIEQATNGQEAVEMMAATDYHLVLMDMHMPVMDGMDATRAIRAAELEGEHTPIVAMTANVVKGTREKCLEAGMDDYLSKPAKPADLKAMLLKYLS